MILTIWRHGQAGSAPTDRERELTLLGREQLVSGARQYHRACQAAGLPLPVLLMHSPWLRTTQTARIVSSELENVPLNSCDHLAPGRQPGDVTGLLAELLENPGHPEHVCLVSHQPLVSRLIDHLSGDTGRVPPLVPGGLAILELDVPEPGCARNVFWAMPPLYEAQR